MWKAPRPKDRIEEIFRLCVSNVADAQQKARLEVIAKKVSDLSFLFESAMTQSKVHGLQKSDYLHGSAAKQDLTELYTKHFSKAGSAGRDLYDRIRVSTPWCCACGHQRVKTLDHYLPKSKFPALSVTPLNLTPMCRDCNEAKSTVVANTAATVFIHPYFEDFEGDIWLGATVEKLPEPHVSFNVIGEHSSDTLERLNNHLKKFKLHEVYGVEAARLVAQSRHWLDIDWRRGGVDQVRFAALEQEESCRAYQLNSWQAAAWGAFAASDWFCNRGYLEFLK